MEKKKGVYNLIDRPLTPEELREFVVDELGIEWVEKFEKEKLGHRIDEIKNNSTFQSLT